MTTEIKITPDADHGYKIVFPQVTADIIDYETMRPDLSRYDGLFAWLKSKNINAELDFDQTVIRIDKGFVAGHLWGYVKSEEDALLIKMTWEGAK